VWKPPRNFLHIIYKHLIRKIPCLPAKPMCKFLHYEEKKVFKNVGRYIAVTSPVLLGCDSELCRCRTPTLDRTLLTPCCQNTTRRNTPEDHEFCPHRRVNLKSCKLAFSETLSGIVSMANKKKIVKLTPVFFKSWIY